MKQVVLCGGNCHNIIRRLGSYKAELHVEEVINGMYTGRIITRVVSLCKNCSELAGYKIHRKNKEESSGK